MRTKKIHIKIGLGDDKTFDLGIWERVDGKDCGPGQVRTLWADFLAETNSGCDHAEFGDYLNQHGYSAVNTDDVGEVLL